MLVRREPSGPCPCGTALSPGSRVDDTASLVLAPVFRRDDHGHSSRQSGVNVFLMTFLAVQVDFDFPARRRNRREQGFSKTVTAGLDAFAYARGE